MTRVAIFPDIHMRDDEVATITEALETTLGLLADRPPDHAFVLGDLIEDGEGAATDEANVERVHEIFSNAPFPVTYTLGNHDVENLSRATLSAVLEQDRFHGVVEFDSASVVYLDSTKARTSGARGELGVDQRTWLEEVLLQRRSPLVFCHHPLGNFDLSDNAWFKDYPELAFLADRKETLDILAEGSPVQGSISGHIHQTEFNRFRGIPHISINAFSKELPDKPVTGTVAEIDIDDEITVDVKTRADVTASYTFSDSSTD